MPRRQPRRTSEPDSGGFGALVYNYMWGPNEFTATGTLKHFDGTGWIKALAVPTLFITGEFDEAAPASVKGDAGDITAYKVACRVREFGVSQERCLDLMLTSGWHERSGGTWTADKLRVKVHNAYNYAQEEAGAALPNFQKQPQAPVQELGGNVPVEAQLAPVGRGGGPTQAQGARGNSPGAKRKPALSSCDVRTKTREQMITENKERLFNASSI
jgi:hypothetical protein